jgi:hypothetical protein
VFGSTRISGNACVSGNARVSGSAQVCESARVYGSAQVFDSAQVYGSAQVFGDARVYGSACVFGSARISGNARITCGEWTRSPICVLGTAFNVNEDGDDLIRIGCMHLTYGEWLEQGPELAKKERLSEHDAARIGRAVEYLHNEMQAL